MNENAYPISETECLNFEKFLLLLPTLSEEKVLNLLSIAKQLAEESV